MKKLLLMILLAFIAITAKTRTLVVYYSYTNNIETIVNDLKTQIDCDVLEIQPAEKGLKYEANNYAIGSAQIQAIRNNPNDADSYPAIDPVSVQWNNYSFVIVATPLWWSNMASPMQSFLFQNGSQMAGKHIGLIVSSASSGISGVESDAKRLIPNGQFVEESLWIRSAQVSNCHTLTATWLSNINYNTLSTMNQIKVSDGTHSVIFELNNTSAAHSLYNMLPLEVEVQNYSNNEKVFYPSKTIEYGNDCIEDNCPVGTLALFSPLGNVVLYYGAAARYSGLYILGHAISGTEQINQLSGKITVTKYDVTTTSIHSRKVNNSNTGVKLYDLNGKSFSKNHMKSKSHSIYIISDGKKTKKVIH